MSPTSRAEAIARSAAVLASAGVEDPARDARLLYRWAAGLDGAALAAVLPEPAPPAELARFDAAVAVRAARTPVSRITGERAFWRQHFRITPAVLDPRPETETLVAAALDGPVARRILDLGTGSGCILLSLLAEWPGARGVGIDISPDALAVAAGNADRLGLAGRAEFRPGDWCEGLAERFDLIVSNPPYIGAIEIDGLAPEVRLHDPWPALLGGADGLDAYRGIAAGVAALLAPAGRVLLEIGPSQAESVGRILSAGGLEVVSILRDLDGRDRVIHAIA